MTRRIALLALGLLAAFGLAAAPASAQYSPNRITLSESQASIDQSFVVTGCCFDPDSDVTATFHSTPIMLGTLRADSQGQVSGSFKVPGGVDPGAHKVELTGTASSVALTLSADIQVVVPGSSVAPAGSLPVTGSNNTRTYTAVAAGLIAVGGVLVLAVRKRRDGVSVAG